MWKASSWRSDEDGGSFLRPNNARILAGEVESELMEREDEDRAVKDADIPLMAGEEEFGDDDALSDPAVDAWPSLEAAKGCLGFVEVGDSVGVEDDIDSLAFLACRVWMESLMLKNCRLSRISCCRNKISSCLTHMIAVIRSSSLPEIVSRMRAGSVQILNFRWRAVLGSPRAAFSYLFGSLITPGRSGCLTGITPWVIACSFIVIRQGWVIKRLAQKS